jgi:hypothetical protein
MLEQSVHQLRGANHVTGLGSVKVGEKVKPLDR